MHGFFQKPKPSNSDFSFDSMTLGKIQAPSWIHHFEFEKKNDKDSES